MRKLLILRGAPGSGKSTWIKMAGLQNYTLSSGAIRLMFSAPTLDENGDVCVSQTHNKVVWQTLLHMLEYRMKNGDFTVIDATHCRSRDFNRYRELVLKYEYKAYCIDFSDIPMEEVMKRNAGRDPLRRVSDSVIQRYCESLKTSVVPEWVTVLRPDEFPAMFEKPISIKDQYRKVLVIGDVHGCYHTLMNAIDGKIKEDCFYVFAGDLLDRGPNNREVLRFALNNYRKKNVVFVKGNHEKHLCAYVAGETIRSSEFEQVTLPQISDFDKKEIAGFCSSLKDCFWFNKAGIEFIVCHGGIPKIGLYENMPVGENLMLISSEDFIKGVGAYAESQRVAEVFDECEKNRIQFHGHRNIFHVLIQESESVYNLEGGVERGGCLCTAEIDKAGQIFKFMYQNKE